MPRAGVTGGADSITVLDRTAHETGTAADSPALAPLVPADPASTEAAPENSPSTRTQPPAKHVGFLRRTWRFFATQTFSSLTRRIVFLNVAGLLALVIGILYLSQFRAGLIDARVQ